MRRRSICAIIFWVLRARSEGTAHAAQSEDAPDEAAPPSTPSLPKTLFEALPVYLEQFQTRHGLEVHLWSLETPAEPLFPANVEEQATRIICEALANVAKHARAGRVDVDFQIADDRVQITITDDGIGFHLSDLGAATDEPEAAQVGHYGLTIMRERAEQVGGTLEIHTEPGAGTRVIVTPAASLARYRGRDGSD